MTIKTKWVESDAQHYLLGIMSLMRWQGTPQFLQSRVKPFKSTRLFKVIGRNILDEGGSSAALDIKNYRQSINGG